MFMRHILFGDSIGFGTGDFEQAGWAGRLRHALDQSRKTKDHTLINLSIPGDTTRGLLARFLPETKVRLRPDETRDDYTLILAMGTNDARIDQANTVRNVPIEEYMQNMYTILDQAEPYFCRTLIIGLPTVDEQRTAPFKLENYYYNSNLALYNSALAGVAAARGLDFVDLHTTWQHLDTSGLFYDGLHPNTEGHARIFEQIWPYIR